MYHHTNSLYTNNPPKGGTGNNAIQQLMGGNGVPPTSFGLHSAAKGNFNLWESLECLPYACLSHFWLATVQEVLQADWQEAWHFPQPPF